MSKCFILSFTEFRSRCLRSTFTKSGLKSTTTDLQDGTLIHIWTPKTPSLTKPNLLLIHGFGTNALWQWATLIPHLAPHFNLYVPDLVFFGGSYTTRPERSDGFQAECLMRVLRELRVGKVSLVGMSYGGFVAYSMASMAMFEEVEVERVVVCCAGVCLEEEDLRRGVFKVDDVEKAADILVPQTAEKLRELIGFAFLKPPRVLPDCLLNDFIDEMCRDYVEERKELIREIPRNRKLAELPKITQPTLIVWGEQDQVFPLELGYRLKRHLGETAKLVVLKNTGHGFLVEKPKEFYKHLKSFILANSATGGSFNHK
ncbi:unnamed protein product [Rhodiola kirilowii]